MTEVEDLQHRVEALEWVLRLVVQELIRPSTGAQIRSSGPGAEPRASLVDLVGGVLARPTDRSLGGPDETQILMTVSEVAEALRIGRSRCYELIRTGEIPSLHLGRSVRVPLTQLRARIDLLANAD